MPETAVREPFDVQRHVITVKGKPYLEVIWRIAWFRHDHPNGLIDTELIRWDPEIAIFKATATIIGEGGVILGRATGYGTETPGDFGDYTEKAETKSIGRALAGLGYGIQHAGDMEDAVVTERRPAPRGDRPGGNPSGKVSDRQRGYLDSLIQQAGWAPADLRREMNWDVSVTYDTMTSGQASAAIKTLKSHLGIPDD